MPSIRFRLEKPTLTGLAARVAKEYGPDARIVDTEESVVGGIGGLFGRRVIDVVVELPDRAAPEGAHEFSMRSRVGLAALLDDADAQDLGPAHLHGADPAARRPAEASLSTQGGDFASVLDSLRIDVEPSTEPGGTPARPARRQEARRPEPVVLKATPTAPSRVVPPDRVLRALEAAESGAPARLPVPAKPTAAPVITPPTLEEAAEALAAEREYVWATPTPRSRVGRTTPGAPPPQRTRAGDLLLLVGLGDDAVHVARAVRDRLQRGYVCDGGEVEGNTRRRVDDRRGAVAARAYGVRSEQPVIVAYGLGEGPIDLDDPRHAGLLSIDSDQAWLVVDAQRDPDHTLDWTGRLRGRLQVDAVASVRATRGTSPAALETIGLPEAWRQLAG
ncbi:hypothetical protein [Amnibacterium endophyticum]|uniref:Uncharacterized protein n=1 Tax=Amnibacterium endophyticum TaxID=2109337 RepID=A0ABW4LD47_9MICO